MRHRQSETNRIAKKRVTYFIVAIVVNVVQADHWKQLLGLLFIFFTDKAWTRKWEKSRLMSSMSNGTWPQGLCHILHLNC